MPGLRPPEGERTPTGGRRTEASRENTRASTVLGTIAVLLVRWEGKSPVFQNTRQIVVPLREHRNETSSDTLYTITSIKKMDCSGNVRRSNLKEFFLFLYIDINYITTTREIRNSSFFLYMMNVSNRRKVRKVTQTTGAYINALPT